MNKPWFRLRASRKTAELLLYQEIGLGGQSSQELFERLEALGALEQITIRINSPGGDVFEALAIHNTLTRHPARIVVTVDALCASAATLVALAGDEVRMADNALWMIHEPWTVAMGNSADLLKQSDLLDTVAEQIVGIYARRTGLTGEEIRDLMRAETWYTAAQALAAGFVDAIDEPLRMAALIRHPLNRFQNAPEEKMTMPIEAALSDLQITERAIRLAEVPDPEPTPEPTPEPDPAEEPLTPVAIYDLCRAEKEPALARVLLQSPHTLLQVKERLCDARAVRNICKIARVPEELADALIQEGAGAAAAKLATWDYLVERDEKTVIDGTPPPDRPKAIRRADFNALNPSQQRETALAGIRIID
jgi:ATP-dependent Clp protease protease subunit